MITETTKPDPAALLPDEDDQKQKHSEIREMISALTRRFADLQYVNKPGAGGTTSHHHDQDDEDDHGVRIITLAGSNYGATIRSELEDIKASNSSPQLGVSLGGGGDDQEHEESLSTYVNSNFQAINNSIIMGGGYSSNDPGVHVDVSEYMEHQAHRKQEKKVDGKRKDKETYKSDQHSQYAD
ncbi:unnamed protein product [Ilex paraguariensis]|uniref:Uncharacterized protein n=2 Tax=Ilex paraguariensis TaxID=185542 RepID=A0ABC8TLH6_9AQUA